MNKPNTFNATRMTDRLLDLRLASYRRSLAANEAEILNSDEVAAEMLREINAILNARIAAIFAEQLSR
tara:strand:+ start:109 stop:312 length:204 start_codon:yes stop_codon:yes gene_type:complete